MATSSPSNLRTKPGCGPTPVYHERPSLQSVVFVPRSALPEPGFQDPAATSPFSTSLSAVHVMQAFNTDVSGDGALQISTERCHQGLQHDPVFTTFTAARDNRDSDGDTTQASSEASIDIITERDIGVYNDVRSASPRKPLPTQWLLPSHSPTRKATQRTGAQGDTQASPSDPPGDCKAVRATRSSIDIGKVHVDATSFLTKEALDAVDANIASPTLRRSPSKLQRSPTKVPWNSPSVSPKIRVMRHSGTSPTKPSPPRATHLDAHTTSDHRRAPSSIVSGATSFHTAHGSPVRSSACSQSSFSSAEDLNDGVYFHCSDFVADVDVEQVTEVSSKAMASSMTAPQALLRSRTSRPELSIRIPPPDSVLDAERKPPSTLASATSSTAVSIEGGSSPALDLLEGHHGTATQSRIPRKSVSKGSSARAPTLSSTLKQTKSTQTLRSPKATKGKIKSGSPIVPKASGTKSLRHVSTIDSTGSTPILSNRQSRDCSIPATAANVATTKIEHIARVSDTDLLPSYLQNTAPRSPELVEDLPTPSTTSRATSTSTVKASQIINDPASSGSTGAWTCKDLESSGNIHPSDADDEFDDSSTSVPDRGRSAQYSPSTRRTTVSEVSMQSSSSSDLRPTATEFVPTLKGTSENDAIKEPFLPEMYALDGYGIPWFYHMYPVPWLLPPMYAKVRSKSPKKLRPKKERFAAKYIAAQEGDRPEASNFTRTATKASVVDLTASTREDGGEGDVTPAHKNLVAASDNIQASDSPFSMQLDGIARQAALQTKTKTVQPPKVDLTTIRNVPVPDDFPKSHAHGYNTVPSRRRNQREIGNGLYGGRGNVGVPLYATAPFPMPIPPMGRPVEQLGVNYAAYAVGTQGCGTVEIEKAAEYGSGQACNTCDPDH